MAPEYQNDAKFPIDVAEGEINNPLWLLKSGYKIQLFMNRKLFIVSNQFSH